MFTRAPMVRYQSVTLFTLQSKSDMLLKSHQFEKGWSTEDEVTVFIWKDYVLGCAVDNIFCTLQSRAVGKKKDLVKIYSFLP